MRRSDLFCETRRQAPADIDLPGHALLVRGGYIQQLAAGLYSLLPLGFRVVRKIEAILRQEMDVVGGQEIVMPVVHPAELWQETGRWYQIGPEMVRFRDRADRDLVLAMTHEEVIADLARKQISSYRQLPVVLYQIQTKFRDEARPRGGLLRVREYVMKDAYSLHVSADDLDGYYPEMYQAYFRVFRRAGIEVRAVLSDVGMMGGTMAHEFMYLTDVGEDVLVVCDTCGYAANRQVAAVSKGDPPAEEPLPLEEVATPNASTIASLATFLNVPETRTAKATFFMAGDRLIFAVVRGDMDVNETKLANVLKVSDLRSATIGELAGTGIVPGYASPIGISGATVVVDDLVARSPNLVAGANREGYHLRNTNVPRDYRPDIVADIVAADDGAPCVRCGSPVRLTRGVEVGHIFKLGTKYTEALGATFLDDQGVARPIVMASYGIGVGRLMACIAEGCHDGQGLAWPVSVAPFHVYLVGLDRDDESVRAVADSAYLTLSAEGIEVLYDDRDERAGVKFNDADLLGMPLRVTVSRRSLAAGGMELRARNDPATVVLAPEQLVPAVWERLDALQNALTASAARGATLAL